MSEKTVAPRVLSWLNSGSKKEAGVADGLCPGPPHIKVNEMKKIIVIIFIIGVVFYFLAKMLSPGSYLNVEKFKFKAKEKALINAVKIFKQSNPKYNIPVEYGINDGKKDTNDYWYHIRLLYCLCLDSSSRL